MNVMEVLSKSCNCQDSTVCDVATFIQNKVAEARCSLNNLLNPRILQLSAICEVENAKSFVCRLLRKAKESVVSDPPAVS